MTGCVLEARREQIRPAFPSIAEIYHSYTYTIIAYLRSVGRVPPVVAALYGDSAMPLDGHHWFDAHRILGRTADAWMVARGALDRLAIRHCRAEKLVMYGRVPATEVARRWITERGP